MFGGEGVCALCREHSYIVGCVESREYRVPGIHMCTLHMCVYARVQQLYCDLPYSSHKLWL